MVKNFIFTTICMLLLTTPIHAQKLGINTTTPAVTLDVNGKMRVGNDTISSSPAGTIRFNQETGDFEGFDGSDWVSFTPNPSELFWPAYGNRGAIGSYFDFSPNDATQGDNFGYAVDIYGSYAVVGSPGWNGGQGRAFVFKREPVFGFWSVVDTLLNPFSSTAPPFFGFSVSIYGDRIVVGAPYQSNEFLNDFGNILIYKRSGNQWLYETGYAPANYCRELGYDVDMYENKIIAGCPGLCETECAEPLHHYGAIYHEIDNTGTLIGWAPIRKNTIPTPVTRFGHAVAISGNWLAVTSPFTNPTPLEDSIYLYKQTAPSFFENVQTLGGNGSDEEFGYAISLHDEKMLIGKRKRDMASAGDDRGEAIMYLRDNMSVWNSHVNIAGQDSLGKLGHVVACSSTHQIVAGYEDPTGYTTTIQSLKLNGGMYSPYVSITDPQATFFDHKVSGVSVNGNYFIVGIADGLSVNGQNGGRIFFGRIR